MNSKHPAAARFLNNGPFDDLTTFAEIKAHISALPTTTGIDDALEFFAEAHLATQKIAKASEVWPFVAIPMDQRITLALDTWRDMGVDGIYQTRSGEWCAYQVTYSSHKKEVLRESLAISFHEKTLKIPCFPRY